MEHEPRLDVERLSRKKYFLFGEAKYRVSKTLSNGCDQTVLEGAFKSHKQALGQARIKKN